MNWLLGKLIAISRAKKLMSYAFKVLDYGQSYITLIEAGVDIEENPSFAERRILRELALPLCEGEDLIVYDIGANIGTYSEAISKARSVKQVVAFEPIPFAGLQLRQRANRQPKLRPVEVALGDFNGATSLHLSASTGSSSLLEMLPLHVHLFPHTIVEKSIEVTVRRLDDIVEELGLPLPDIVKIDVQGFEDRVLAGSENTLRHAQWLLVEMTTIPLYHDAPLFDNLYSDVRALGFAVTDITEQLRSSAGELLQMNVLFRRMQ